MRRRAQLIPWKVAGRVTEQQASGDEVVQATGWVFNNETGDTLTLAEFVATGDNEVPAYLERFGLVDEDDEHRSFVEIGCGIGRMTCAFTRRFGTVFACDLDAGFLERCREAVARYGKVDRLRTVEVSDGRSLALPDQTADIAFSYITLQ
ncbi:MAG: class I SAM-dependent methyltransferase, partial [Ilumatobacteraceae bacterium]